MRNILTIFMVQYLAIAEMDATSVYHVFVAGCYLMPLFGGYLADRHFGKYQVILWLSIVYCIGHGVIALFETKTGLYWGLGLIAVGSGGIKPCVSAFGSSTSAIVTPLLLAYFSPSIAFGVPGILMAIATVIFWMGRKQYIIKPPVGKNPHGFMPVMSSALKNRQPGKSFLEGALKDHPVEAIDAVKSVLGIMTIFFTAMPVFWALFDQHGSTWVLQAKQMDLTFMGIAMKPSQIQALNPYMVMILIPIFTFYVYPAIQKVYDFTPLRRMGWGMVIAAFSFAQIGLIQYQIDAGHQLNVMWQFFPYLTITIAEVMISITGLEFAYTQAPPSMKSTIMSFWLLTTFLGNFIVAVVAKINIFEGGTFFMFFALLMLVASGIFGLMAKNYKMREMA
ncbi:MAG: MFS transporter, partial [Pseudomonadota bacterium]